jgi:hypothetical protein
MGDGKIVSLATGVLAVLVGFSATGKASEITMDAQGLYPIKTDQHIASFLIGSDAPSGADLAIFAGATPYTEVGPLATRVSAVDLFANPSIFQYAQSELFGDAAAASSEFEVMESQVWQNPSLLSGKPVSFADAATAQLLAFDFPAGDGPNAGRIEVTLEQFQSNDISPNLGSTQLDLPAVGFDLSRDQSEPVNLTASVPEPRQLARGQATSISVPNSPASPSIVPEPASLSLFGVAAFGMLARRRANKA